MQRAQSLVDDRNSTQKNLSNFVYEIKENKDVNLPKNYDTILDILHDELYDDCQNVIKNGGIDLSLKKD